MKIKDIKARKILNSNGNWTIEAEINANGQTTTASVPAGISLGEDEKSPVAVEKAIDQVTNEIFSAVKNKDLTQSSLDKILAEGGWGANATLAVSAAFFKMGNPVQGVKSPKLMMLIFEGKEHGNKNLKIQEFMFIFNTIEEGVRVYQKIKKRLESEGVITTVGVEGGFSPLGFNDKKILTILKEYKLPIAIDVAANTSPMVYREVLQIFKDYPVISIEDPFPESDRNLWQKLSADLKNFHPDVLVVGDDLTVTDKNKIDQAAAEKLINAVVIKPNQQGTITAAVEAVNTAKNLGLKTVVSHRGESTNDTWIADFAVINQVDYVKFGAPARGERIAKYNRLLESRI